jgi:plasmid stabilization system protein ParE
MAKRKIIWSNRAEFELQDILHFYILRNKSKKFSIKLLKETKKSIQMLSSHPFIGRISDNYKTRVLRKEYISVFYEVSDRSIEIISVWHNLQDPLSRLDKD